MGFLLLSSCNEKTNNPYKGLTLDAFSELSSDCYKLDARVIRERISGIAENDGAPLSMDIRTRKFYLNNNRFIWINRLGVFSRADTLLSIIRQAGRYGFNARMFRTDAIEEDLKRVRSLDVGGGNESINEIMARLEYNLTKAYLRYSASMRYGIVNPDHLYNNFEKYDLDSVTTRFRQLSDLDVERPDDAFYVLALTKAFNDSIGEFLSELQPDNHFYRNLIERLNNVDMSASERIKTICNIERCRWQFKLCPDKAHVDKYVEVNIPSFSLRAVDGDSLLIMRIGCGTLENKTPLLAGLIKRMDVNPQWIVPKSISKGFLHNYEYMHKMGMFVLDKKDGKLPPESASYGKVMNGEQFIVQAGGPKNSLGRIIFRFDNNFSVFLHDTSSPWVFQRKKRAVSHGCVRVEKPFELALFLMDDKDEEIVEKLKYSMTVKLVNDKDSLTKNKIDRKKLVNSLPVRPAVPLFVRYFTVYWGDDGRLADFQDIYGYDEALAEQLKPYIE